MLSSLVSIVILNWNNPQDTIECLHSVLSLNYPNFSTLVVDNGSTDDSVSKIKDNYPDIEIIETNKNLGYAEGNNIGIRHAIQSGADYILVLNNDTIVETNMLMELVRVAESRLDAGMIGPTIYCTNPNDKLFAAGSFVLWRQGDLDHRGMFELPGSYVYGNNPELVDFIVGCGVLIPRSVVEKIGLLESKYYLNFEDVEWGVRANRYGYKVFYAPKAIMWHKVSATLGQASPANTYYMTRNALLFFWENIPSVFRRWVVVMQIILRTLRTVMAWTFRSKYQGKFFKQKSLANILAIRDFLLGSYGEMGEDVYNICFRLGE
jgi:GT2 family glycosyltransferase